MKISKKAQYGLRAMVYLAKNKKTVSPLKAVAKAEGISFDFLEKILKTLETAGLIISKKGAGGGYYIKKNIKKITAGDIVEALEGKIVPVSCSFCSKSRKCVSKSVWDRVKKSLAQTLHSITLADLTK